MAAQAVDVPRTGLRRVGRAIAAGRALSPWALLPLCIVPVLAPWAARGSVAQEPRTSVPYDPGRLAPGAYRYRVTAGGGKFGWVTTELERGVRAGRAVFHATSTFQTLQNEAQNVELWFDAETFEPLQTLGSGQQAAYAVSIELTYRVDRVTGRMAVSDPNGAGDPPGGRRIDVPLVPGTLDPNQLRYALASAPLAPGYAFELPIFDVTQGDLLRLSLEVTGVESVTVPAGTFDAFRVEMTGGQFPMTWYVTTRSPRRVVRQEFDAGGATVQIELLP